VIDYIRTNVEKINEVELKDGQEIVFGLSMPDANAGGRLTLNTGGFKW
jgi:hypothetical protein